MEKYYLGLDLSTQQLKCTVINDVHEIVYEDAVNFGRDLPEFLTDNGVIVQDEERNVVTSPPLMWTKAVDILLARLVANDMTKHIIAIAGAGQQHGSVYWSKQGADSLACLDTSRTLEEQLSNAFARQQSPIWQDSSTTKQCHSLEESVGGPLTLAQLTGSKAYERFTGNQIAKIYEQEKETYDATYWITLVSSFMATLLLGHLGAMDAAEGSGTNMMNLTTHQWEPRLLTQCGGPDLAKKLGLQPRDDARSLGPINQYYVQRYHFRPDCQIIPFTGDNSATMISMNLQHGDCVVSLGTSDTVLMSVRAAEPTSESHLLVHPTDPHGFMGMLCYKNGSLTRQHFRDIYAQGDWDTFNLLLTTPSISTSHYTGFYYWQQEIIPYAKGIYRFQDDQLVDEFTTSDANDDAVAAINVRCLVESQFLSMRSRLQCMTSEPLQRLMVTGGAAINKTLVQILANVFGVDVYRLKKGNNSASLGGALLAKYGIQSTHESIDAMIREHQTDDPFTLFVTPDFSRTADYARQLNRFRWLEATVVAL
ncbi:actin-like ATPase domain-containing protein [Hesseltinella vesiculosa]|uniref:Xylulose kinase n=1 Tax=Hesseltinella vesiculosa TaxID=101127 RepID=A0A1X2GNI5_9FUNG|nr:actin-like ATPase domain-containing protein [Hesseltinella vesiculosa]